MSDQDKPVCRCYENMAYGFTGDCPVHDVRVDRTPRDLVVIRWAFVLLAIFWVAVGFGVYHWATK